MAGAFDRALERGECGRALFAAECRTLIGAGEPRNDEEQQNHGSISERRREP
ncbi:MAG TPA: hypothetical protein VL742_06570 [Casimicrobiaceae bacterium]|nr:hypothetical protein [Casimicrobiaceae bacterium]